MEGTPARVAKSADAKDLKSFFRQRECGFKSHPGHHINSLLLLVTDVRLAPLDNR